MSFSRHSSQNETKWKIWRLVVSCTRKLSNENRPFQPETRRWTVTTQRNYYFIIFVRISCSHFLFLAPDSDTFLFLSLSLALYILSAHERAKLKTKFQWTRDETTFMFVPMRIKSNLNVRALAINHSALIQYVSMWRPEEKQIWRQIQVGPDWMRLQCDMVWPGRMANTTSSDIFNCTPRDDDGVKSHHSQSNWHATRENKNRIVSSGDVCVCAFLIDAKSEIALFVRTIVGIMSNRVENCVL